ncbi:unnamed protein product (macronuclear) [Paramecium tetraurelia]|uniref:Uncharacterized protein n=1 Tax=Paramecium tetraurelia TaxID=5888 RepID=A0BHD3_PARTE|nr:uncharacterized protein GSPATT00028985001 [Paramecium tetraurelia]CAK57950.1 unnamed protein product [Paramecium tetraurelia]|eukprot:XP_001425348.1 hypothetical protein (macronuclear) [Paramecium tetraurelia strain d4-2]
MSDEEPKEDDQDIGDNPDKENPDKQQDDQGDQDNFEDVDDYQDEDDPRDDEDLKNNETSNNLKLTIDDLDLDENQKLRKWKDLLTDHVLQVQKLRGRNNRLRGELKKLGDKAEKLVQSNVRKQKLLEQKLDPKHYNLAEKKILYEIKNGKSKQDFANKIDPRILDLLIAIDKMEQSNNQMRESIKALKDRNKNLEQTEDVNKLSNEIVLVEKQIADEDRLRRKMQVIMKEQESELKQQQFDCDYEGRLNSLKEQIKTLRDSIKEGQKEELHETRKEFELNNHFAELQKIYRQMCNQLNKPCEEKQHFKQDKQRDQDNMNEKLKKVQEFAQKSQEENQKRFLQIKENKKEPEEKDELKKALEEFKKDENKFKQIQEEVKQLQEDLEKKEREAQKEKNRQVEEYAKLSEDVGQLAKQLKEKEIQTKSQVLILNDLQRQAQLLEKKQIAEPIQSTQQKSESLMRGITEQTQTCLPFDDSKNLDWTSYMPVNQIVVCKNSINNLIVGLELTYGSAENEEEQKTTKNIGLQEGNIEKVEIKITPEEKLSYISGFHNKEQIIFLKFETTKKRVIQVGNMKYKDNFTKDFRIEIKDKEIQGFSGILDFTNESSNPSERYLVALGVNLKQKEDISAKKKQKKQQMEEEKEKQRVPIDYRKITYPFRKNQPKHLELVKSQPKLEVSIYEEEKSKLFQKEKERFLQAQRAQLGFLSAKQFSPATYKQQEYLTEDKLRKEKNKERKNWVEQKREENKNSLTLPLIDLKSPVEQDKKGAKGQKTASPQKQQKQPQKEAPKKDDSKAKKK